VYVRANMSNRQHQFLQVKCFFESGIWPVIGSQVLFLMRNVASYWKSSCFLMRNVASYWKSSLFFNAESGIEPMQGRRPTLTALFVVAVVVGVVIVIVIVLLHTLRHHNI
jgi:hypothetical protein